MSKIKPNLRQEYFFWNNYVLLRITFLLHLELEMFLCEISKNSFFKEHLWTTASVTFMHHIYVL